MTTDYKTLRVPEYAWTEAKEQKEAAGRTWGEQVVRPEDGDNDSTTFDWSEFDKRLQEHLAEWEITVNLDQLDLDPVGMDEADVENIIESWMENNWRNLQKGNF